MPGIIFFGTPQFSVPALKALLEEEDVLFVVTRKDALREKDKKHVIGPSPVKELALDRGLQVLQPGSLKDPAFISELEAAKPEFLVVVAYGRILPPEVLRIPSVAPVNVHASLLPKYRGASPIAWAIINGEKETGVTTMRISRELDSGDIYLAEKTPILEEETAGALSERLSAAGAELLLKTLRGLRTGSVKPVPQEGRPSFAPPLKKEDGLIDWNKTAAELSNFVRGMDPWPGAYCFLAGERLTILKARPSGDLSASPPLKPGRVITGITGGGDAGPERFLVAAGPVAGRAAGPSRSTLLEVLELKPAGKRRMAAAEYLRGRSFLLRREELTCTSF